MYNSPDPARYGTFVPKLEIALHETHQKFAPVDQIAGEVTAGKLLFQNEMIPSYKS